jgi:hypothetical protein
MNSAFDEVSAAPARPATLKALGVEIDAKPTLERFSERLAFDSWSGQPLTELVNEAIWFPCR